MKSLFERVGRRLEAEYEVPNTTGLDNPREIEVYKLGLREAFIILKEEALHGRE